MRRRRSWTRWLVAIPLALTLLSTGCWGRGVEYRSATKQVFFLPEGTVLVAPPGKSVRTGGPTGPVDGPRMVLPYDGIVLSEGRFADLVEAAAGRK